MALVKTLKCLFTSGGSINISVWDQNIVFWLIGFIF